MAKLRDCPENCPKGEIKVGSNVKVAIPGVRFYVKVTSVKGNRICGISDENGKKLCFSRKKVWSLW